MRGSNTRVCGEDARARAGEGPGGGATLYRGGVLCNR